MFYFHHLKIRIFYLLFVFCILCSIMHVLSFLFLFSGDPWYHNHQTFNSPRIKLAPPLRPLGPLQPAGPHHLHQVHHSGLGPAGVKQSSHHGILRLLPAGRLWEARLRLWTLPNYHKEVVYQLGEHLSCKYSQWVHFYKINNIWHHVNLAGMRETVLDPIYKSISQYLL